ncbi:MAG: hypothetical protein A2138_01415 [Deltaproteobacteria bacterium RBG_16_71_12]|nr:MAG: hypothetical protein A2138_01415 [Deltaproteobacteria bacterium RBG_16_71_12]
MCLRVRYAACFCEENVWQLAHERAGLAGERQVVFVLGADPATPAVAVWRQRAAAGAPFVIWDYHVVLFERAAPGAAWQAWDQDSTLGAPVDAAAYLAATFPRELPGLAPRFRVIEAGEFLREFSSDRRHMRGQGGAELRPFPPWPPILDALRRHLLPRFLDARDGFVGELCDLAGLRARFTTTTGAA